MTAPNPPGALPACDACGAPSEAFTPERPHYTIFEKMGLGENVYLCAAHKLERSDKTAEMIRARRRKSSSEPMPEDAFVPKVGEMCEGDAPHQARIPGEKRRGTFVSFRTTDYAGGNPGAYAELQTGASVEDCHLVTRASLRPASAQRIESESTEPVAGEWYEGETTVASRIGDGVTVRGKYVRQSSQSFAGVFLDCPDQPAHPDGHHLVSVIKLTLRRCAAPSAKPPEAPIAKPERVIVSKFTPPTMTALEMQQASCHHPRRFRSGLCVTCGHVGPGENDAGYAIRGEHETEPEAVARRERVARIQAVFNCPHNTNPGAYVDVGTRTCSACGISEMEFHVLRTHERRGRPNYGAGGIDRRIAAAVSECRASLETDGRARREAVSTHPSAWPEGSCDETELAATEGWSGR